jgi:hypothetical protein
LGKKGREEAYINLEMEEEYIFSSQSSNNMLYEERPIFLKINKNRFHDIQSARKKEYTYNEKGREDKRYPQQIFLLNEYQATLRMETLRWL